MKMVTENRQARHEYFIDETYVAGIVLEGAEVKSVRNNSVSLVDSFCHIYNGEVFIKNMHKKEHIIEKTNIYCIVI